MKNLIITLLALSAILASCNKTPDDYLQNHIKNNVKKITIPIYYYSSYSYDQRDYKLKKHSSWYDMYQSIYNNNYQYYLGRLFVGSGIIIYKNEEDSLLQISFNPSDEQSYYELTQHIERAFQNSFIKIDSTLHTQKATGDSLIFLTSQPSKYQNISEVEVIQTVDLYR